jgi:hypothetical protein
MSEDNINDWNTRELKKRGINRSGVAPTISRNQGDLQRATLPDGTVVKRQEYIFENLELVKTAPYELHFIYQTPDINRYKGWSLWCTCGSIAGIVGFSAYSKLASPSSTGKMIVCIRHTTTKNNIGIGQHADGSTE